MSFYDDASLVFLAGGAAGKDGKAYSLKPDGSLGSELIADGGFDSASRWTNGTGWSISGGVASCDGTQTATTNLHETAGNGLVNGKTYRIEYTITSYSAGSIRVKAGNTGFGTYRSATGTYVENLVAGVTTFPIVQFNADADFIGSIDNVSCKEADIADFTFTRGTNLTATRVGKDGYIEKGRENLLTYSNQFDTDWATSNVSVTSGQTGYDGTSDAWLLERTATSAYLQQYNTSSGVLCYSIYLKKGTYNWAYVRVQDNTGYKGVYFDLENGTNGSVDSGIIDYNIEAVGTNGWHRCSIVLNDTLIRAFIYPSETNNGVFNAGTGNIYIQDAQLEQGLVATDYIETGATTATAGLLEDEPRFDYTGGGCPALLMEPQRTNKVPYSEYFEASDWNTVGTVTLDFGYEAPDGTNSAYKVSGTTSSALYLGGAGIVAGDTRSIWAKTVSGEGTVDLLTYNANTDNTFTVTNEWQRFELTGSPNAIGQANIYAVDFRGAGNTLTELLLWGAQAEAGDFATSYIPTYGSSATRDGDGTVTASPGMLTGGYDLSSSWSLFVDANSLKKSGTSSLRFLGLHTSGDYNVQLYVNTTGLGLGVNPYLQNTGDYVFGFNSNDAGSEDGFKICLTYDAGTNKISYYINGSLYDSTTSALTFGDETYGYIQGPSTLPTTPTTDVSVGFKQILFAPTAFSGNDSEILTGATSYSSFADMATSTALNYTIYE